MLYIHTCVRICVRRTCTVHFPRRYKTQSLNARVRQVLRLLAFLIKFGYYEDFAEIQRILGPLIDILDGHNDLPSPGHAIGMLELCARSRDSIVQL